jgi:hypothetical protein
MPPPGQTQRAASKYIVFENFEKMNTQSVRQALSEKELAWLENLQPIAPNNLTTVPGPAVSISSISETITAQYYANLGTADYIISFTSAGSGWYTNIANGTSARFAPPSTFTNPDLTVWESQYVIINDSKSSYASWNGTVFVQQGGVSPNITLENSGSGYTTVPTVTITGGSGTGATAVATIGTPGVLAVNVITGGTSYTTAPGVVFSGGGGTGAAATANIDPQGVVTVTITSSGSYFQTNPGVLPTMTVAFTGGGGTGAAATATLSQLSPSVYYLSSIAITAPGSGYTSNPTVVLTISGATTSTAAHATCVAGNGAVLSITVTNEGSGYTSVPSVSFSGGGGGSGATATAVIGGSGVTSVTMTNPGSGYLASDVLTVVFSGGGQITYTVAASGSTYNSTTGAVHLVLTTSASIGVGANITVENLTGTGGFASLDGVFETTTGTTGTTVNYTAATALGTTTITGGTVVFGTLATATAHVWPFVTAGTTIAVFQGRVWLGGGRLIQYTGTEGFDDFNLANASGQFTISDADLTHAVTALRNYNNYLFIMGDQSVKQIGNISLNSAGNATLFTLLTLSSDQGTIYPRSCGSFNRVFFFCNTNGVYAVFGSTVQKVSDDLDGIFKLIDFTQQPQAAIADFNNIHNITWLVRYVDPVAGERSILLTFDGKKWFVCAQGNSLVSLTTASTLASGKNMTYASSGSDITQIFGSSTVPVAFKAQTALTHHGNAVQRKASLRAGWAITGGSSNTISFEIDSDEGTQSGTQNIVTSFLAYLFANNPANVSGRFLGATITGTAPVGFTLTNITIEYKEENVGNK